MEGFEGLEDAGGGLGGEPGDGLALEEGGRRHGGPALPERLWLVPSSCSYIRDSSRVFGFSPQEHHRCNRPVLVTFFTLDNFESFERGTSSNWGKIKASTRQYPPPKKKKKKKK